MSRHRLTAILVFQAFCLSCFGCDVDDVALYRVKLKTFWDEETFPMDYPANAHWSKLFGQSHNNSYALYRLNHEATRLMRNFAELGNLEELMEAGNDNPKVYDQFVAPAVKEGAGETENVVFVDGGHSLISVVSRLNPSPDWFVGVDSLELCVDANWVDQVTLDLEVLDAGVVNGETFTQEVPWPTEPAEEIAKLNIRNPHSPFSNFYYRKLRHMLVAQIEFTKMKEYSTKELNDLARKELISNLKPKPIFDNIENHHEIHKKPRNSKHSHDRQIYEDSMTTKNPFALLKDLEEDPIGIQRPNNPDNNVFVVTEAPKFDSEENFDKKLKNMDDVVLAVATGHSMGLGRHLPRHFKSRLHHAVNRNHDHDCVVSEWDAWSDCSDPCSKSGEMVRRREVLRKRQHGGRECPELVEKKSCSHVCRGDDYGW